MNQTAADRSFGAFVQGRGSSLMRTCYLLTGSRQDAEDLLQTALMRCLKHWPRIQARGGEEAYVRTVIAHAHISAHRKRRLVEVVSSVLPDRATPSDTEALDERDRLRRALAELPPRTRTAVVLRHYEGLTERETAEILGCSVGNVKALTHRGLQRLRDEMVPQPGRPSAPVATRSQ